LIPARKNLLFIAGAGHDLKRPAGVPAQIARAFVDFFS
jgi:hypothetical protein